MLLADGCVRYGLSLPQHSTIKHENPQVILFAEKHFGLAWFGWFWVFFPYSLVARALASKKIQSGREFGVSPCCLSQRQRSCTAQASVEEGKALWSVEAVPRVVHLYGLSRESRGGLLQLLPVQSCNLVILQNYF